MLASMSAQVAESASRATTMPLADVLDRWIDGEGHGWVTEAVWLLTHDRQRMNELIASIRQHGILEPILLGTDGRVWDGHHRIVVAWLLRLREVPVKYA